MVKPWHLHSSYQEEFKPYSTNMSNLGSTSSQLGIKSVVSFGNKNNYETTSKNAFQKVSHFGTSTPDLGKYKNKKEMDILYTSKNHYATAYGSDFTNKPIQANLSRLR